MPDYNLKEKNVIQDILQDHFSAFEEKYDAQYSEKYGTYRIIRIKETVEHFIECGDYSKGIARIKCTNTHCEHEYFRPFVASLKEMCKSCPLSPICNQKRMLFFSEHLWGKSAPEAPPPAVCIYPPEAAPHLFQIQQRFSVVCWEENSKKLQESYFQS